MNNNVVFSVTKKDFEVTWFSGSGGGGQHRNKHKNCCRLKHIDTGIIKVGTKHKERSSNQKDALTAMSKDAKFKAYCESKLREIEKGITIEQEIDEMMKPENLLIQCKDENDNWVKYE